VGSDSDVGPQPDVVEPQPDVAEPQPDAVEPQPDVAEPQPDAVEPQPDVAEPQPDVVEPAPDAAEPQPDVAEPQPDVAEVSADAPEDGETGPVDAVPDATPCEGEPNLGQPCDGPDSDQCTNGTWTCNGDGTALECVNESLSDIVEVCDGADNDCDGATDEDFGVGEACDSDDSDLCPNGSTTCTQDGMGVECLASNETQSDITEVCDTVDNDCDGETDEGFDVGQACDSNDTDLCANGVTTCTTDGTDVECLASNETMTDLSEVCGDGADNDCDGVTDCPGDFVAADAFGGADFDIGLAVEPAPDGGAIVAGTFRGPMDVTPTLTLNGIGDSDIFVARYGPTGDLVWVVEFGDTGVDEASDLAVAADGAIFLTGAYSGGPTFGATQLISGVARNGFIARLNYLDGSVVWAKAQVGDGLEVSRGVALTADEASLLVCGHHEAGNPIEFGPGEAGAQTLTNVSGLADTYAAWFDAATGDYITGSAVFWGGTGQDYCGGVSVRPNGTGLVTGLNTAGTTLPGVAAPTATDGALVAVNPTSGILWAKGFGGSGEDQPNRVLATATTIFVVGSVDNGAVFGAGEGNETTVTTTGRDAFLAAFSGSGILQWVETGGGPGFDIALGVAASDQHVVWGGYVDSGAVFGSQTGLFDGVGGGGDGFVAVRDASTGALDWVTRVESPGFAGVYAVGTDGTSVFGTGYFETSVEVGGTSLSGVAGADYLYFQLKGP